MGGVLGEGGVGGGGFGEQQVGGVKIGDRADFVVRRGSLLQSLFDNGDEGAEGVACFGCDRGCDVSSVLDGCLKGFVGGACCGVDRFGGVKGKVVFGGAEEGAGESDEVFVGGSHRGHEDVHVLVTDLDTMNDGFCR